jgi:carboxyl-terminal processing protease
LFLLLSLLAAVPVAAQTPTPAQYREDAQSIEAMIDEVYAYPERLPGGRFTLTPRLRAEAAAVTDRSSLLRFAERALLLLADHHAIASSNFADSYALVPSHIGYWIEARDGGFVVDAVRYPRGPGPYDVRPGDRLLAIDGVPMADAVAAFWRDLGADPAERDAGFAARVLVAGRRNQDRRITLQRGSEAPRELVLAAYSHTPMPMSPPLTVSEEAGALRIRINDRLGDQDTIARFDAAMARARPRQRVIVDLTDTPGGGNSSVARGILGWFVDRPRFYQMHALPAEERETGIARLWVEQVLPRAGKRHRGPVRVEVSRWTGSMGEGLAIGFDAIGVEVRGTRMAGLRGAVYDRQLAHSGLVLKLPAERLMHVNGTPREAFVPH